MSTFTFKFSDLQELSNKLEAFNERSTIWGDDADEYELVVKKTLLSDGSMVRDFKIRPVDAGEPVELTFNAHAHRENARQFKAANGVMFTVRILRDGDSYGLNDCLTWGADSDSKKGPGVEFYDARYPHSTYGQFVSRYYYDTLAKDRCSTGLNLHGGVDSWTIDASTMDRIMTWLEGQQRLGV